ncbi:MAG: TonB-dependent receptor [Woeseiaceae bacterium]|nr:TonB-dependent receptor [Gammaproteobacteria bacterium]NNK25524.1 TonB-dependent receptor [Woeseiaceae bacterium]
MAVAVAVGSTFGAPSVSVAQDDQGGEVIEEIITTGIRGSLMRSMDVKRGSSGVVDAISAEDIGKFPDQNLAESLQRITGVSIDRQRGEGSTVTVRGFGPEYNLVTVNGRQMPTHNGVTRSFDFGDLASEGVAGVKVYKTGRADVPSGGIGSTIDIQTPQPLEGEPTASLAARTVFDRSTRTGDEVTPELSGIYVGRFLDDKFGIAITASHQIRNNGVNTAFVDGWYTRPGDDVIPDGTVDPLIPNDGNQINRPTTANENYSFPQNLGYRIEEFDTERTNGQLVLQWAPTDSITATVDYIRSEFELERSYSNMSAWFTNTAALSQSSEWTDGPIASPIYYSEEVSNGDFAMGIGEDGSKNLNESTGLNVEWWLNDRLRLEFDYNDASAETGANSPNGTSALISMASFNKVGQSILTGAELPILVQDLNSGGEANRPLYRNDMLITGSVFGNGASLMELEQAKIAGSFDFFDSSSIDFGVQTTEVTNRSQSSSVQLDNWGGINGTDAAAPGYISDILNRASIAGQFDELSGSGHPDLWTEYFTASLADLQARAEAAYASSGKDYAETGDCGTGYCASTDWSSDLRTTEESLAVYLQYNWSGDLFNVPANLKVGVRYEETDVTSAAKDVQWAGSSWIGAGNELNIEQARDADGNVIQSFENVFGNYDVTLPNFDFDIEPWEDIVMRLSVSETMTRPSYNDIKGGLSPDGTQYFGNVRPTASSGNPGLVPIQSFNIDLSFEWYYGNGSYLSVGYFDKDVENFIGTGRTSDTLFEIPNIIGGELFNRALQESGLDPNNFPDIGQYILDNYQDDPLVDGDTIVSGPNDPSVVFDISRPINEKTANLDGFEVNLQHNFGESGFGFIINATLVNGDIAYDNFNSLEGQFVLNGLSDSANLIGFYDGEDLQVRLAYNWRDDFLAGTGQAQGTRTNPTNVEAYGQWDLNVTYYYNDNLTLYFSGLNLTEETRHVYGLSKQQVLQAVQGGPRYDFGLRYNFF